MIERRSPHQVGKAISKGINEGRINFFDKHLSMFPVDLVYVSLLRHPKLPGVPRHVGLRGGDRPILELQTDMRLHAGILHQGQA